MFRIALMLALFVPAAVHAQAVRVSHLSPQRLAGNRDPQILLWSPVPVDAELFGSKSGRANAERVELREVPFNMLLVPLLQPDDVQAPWGDDATSMTEYFGGLRRFADSLRMGGLLIDLQWDEHTLASYLAQDEAARERFAEGLGGLLAQEPRPLLTVAANGWSPEVMQLLESVRRDAPDALIAWRGAADDLPAGELFGCAVIPDGTEPPGLLPFVVEMPVPHFTHAVEWVGRGASGFRWSVLAEESGASGVGAPYWNHMRAVGALARVMPFRPVSKRDDLHTSQPAGAHAFATEDGQFQAWYLPRVPANAAPAPVIVSIPPAASEVRVWRYRPETDVLTEGLFDPPPAGGLRAVPRADRSPLLIGVETR